MGRRNAFDDERIIREPISRWCSGSSA